jgi:uncharacterized phage protein (TIGR01671 family)
MKMREILFRGKRVSNGEWVVGYLIHDEFCNTQTPYIGYLTIDGCNVADVIPETVGQYTGLTDKNGKKIFEGDIVNIYYPETIVENTVIKYIGASFYGDRFDDTWELDDYYQLEIIGNIHDNIELLGENNG